MQPLSFQLIEEEEVICRRKGLLVGMRRWVCAQRKRTHASTFNTDVGVWPVKNCEKETFGVTGLYITIYDDAIAAIIF